MFLMFINLQYAIVVQSINNNKSQCSNKMQVKGGKISVRFITAIIVERLKKSAFLCVFHRFDPVGFDSLFQKICNASPNDMHVLEMTSM